jgi:hypothetical protein
MFLELRLDESLIPAHAQIFRPAGWEVAVVLSQAMVDLLAHVPGIEFLPCT